MWTWISEEKNILKKIKKKCQCIEIHWQNHI